jgi:hypothetical protein
VNFRESIAGGGGSGGVSGAGSEGPEGFDAFRWDRGINFGMADVLEVEDKVDGVPRDTVSAAGLAEVMVQVVYPVNDETSVLTRPAQQCMILL